MAKQIIRAAHINGYMKMALLRDEVDVAGIVAKLEQDWCWRDITVAPFVPPAKNIRRAA